MLRDSRIVHIIDLLGELRELLIKREIRLLPYC